MGGAQLTLPAVYRAGQKPVCWLLSAERLRDAAEVILSAEVVKEIPYFRAHEEATRRALSIACTGTNEAGHAEIPCDPPNYPPAQLLYAYAIENALKGLIVADDAAVLDENSISKKLKSHDLIELSAAAGVTVHVEEQPILAALSDLSVWAGRYPVASRKEGLFREGKSPRDARDPVKHVIMRRFFDRVRADLDAKLPGPASWCDVVVVFRPPGT